MCPRVVCAHGLGCERNTAAPDLLAYCDARRTGPRLRYRRAAEPAPAQRCEPGMPTSGTYRPPLRSSYAAMWAPCEGCGSVAVCRRVDFAPRRAVPRGRATHGAKADFSSRAPRAYPRLRTHVCPSARTHVRERAHAHARAHTHMHARVCVHKHACTHALMNVRVLTLMHALMHALMNSRTQSLARTRA